MTSLNNKEKNKIRYIKRIKECLTISKYNFLKMILYDNSFIMNCKDCDFIAELNFSKNSSDKLFIECIFCNTRFKNLSYDIEMYYNLKLQIFMVIFMILINFFIFVNFINTFSMEIIQHVTVFIILDQSIIRIKIKKLNLIIFMIIGCLTLFKSYEHFIVYLCSLGFCIKEIYKVKEKIINSEVKKINQ